MASCHHPLPPALALAIGRQSTELPDAGDPANMIQKLAYGIGSTNAI
jgi:hypothetical protein